MCASGKATQHTIRRCTIRKIIKTEFLSPRVFIDFSYWASRRLGKFNLKNPPDGGFFDFTGYDTGCVRAVTPRHKNPTPVLNVVLMLFASKQLIY